MIDIIANVESQYGEFVHIEVLMGIDGYFFLFDENELTNVTTTFKDFESVVAGLQDWIYSGEDL